MVALSERFELRLDQDILQSVDSWRSKQPGVPSRAEAIRRLVEKGLAAEGGSSVRFSPGETLLVHMMCEVLKTQKIRTDFDPDFIQAALLGGHLWALEWDMQGTFHTHVDDRSVVSEVVDMLDMWDFVELSYEKLDKKEKALVEKEAEPFGTNPKFQGFDGNNEAGHMGVAMFLLRNMGRFSRFKNREANSHFPTSLEGYRRMLKVFAPMRPTLAGATMSAAQIIDVLRERIHPSHRGKKK